MRFPAVLRTPRGETHRVEGELVDELLSVVSSGGRIATTVDTLVVTTAGGAVVLGWTAGADAWSLTVDDPEAIARLATLLPEDKARSLRVTSGRPVLVPLLMLAALLGLVALLVLR